MSTLIASPDSAPLRADAPAVLYLSAEAGHYGSDRALETLATAVLRRNGRAAVAFAEDGPLVSTLRSRGAEVSVMPLGVLRRRLVTPQGAIRVGAALMTSRLRLRRLASAAPPHLIHTNTSTVLGGGAIARRLGVPHVWHVREHLGSVRGGRLIAMAVDRGADVVVAVSEAVADDLVFLRPRLASRIVVIKDGVDMRRLEHLPHRDAAAGRLGVDPRRFVVVCAARINRWKGQEVLVDAIAQLNRRGWAIQAVLAGDIYPGNESIRAALVDRAAAAGLEQDVRFVGFREDLRDLYAVADVLVAPSLRPEPYGLTVLEALTSGVPVVASNSGGHRETVRDGVDGVLVAPGDADALAAALQHLLEDADLRNRYGAAAKEAARRFSLEESTGAILELYRSLTPANEPSRAAA